MLERLKPLKLRYRAVTGECLPAGDSPPGDLAPGVLDWLRAPLTEAVRLNAERPNAERPNAERPGARSVEIRETGWRLRAARESGALLRLALWRGARAAGRAHVAGDLETCAGEAVLTVDLSGLSRIRPRAEIIEAAQESGDLVRGLAWAWLTRERIH